MAKETKALEITSRGESIKYENIKLKYQNVFDQLRDNHD